MRIYQERGIRRGSESEKQVFMYKTQPPLALSNHCGRAMATAKPPLHNFPLSFLKWGTNTNSNNRYADDDDENNNRSDSPPPPRVGSRSTRHRFPLGSCSEKAPPTPPPPQNHNDDHDDDKATSAAAEDQKPWNLRPRRASLTTAMTSKASSNNEVHEAEALPKSMRLRGMAAATAEGGASEAKTKKEKRRFWIALSKEEIEEDIFIMTGSRPARRPKKRPKNVQKQLDNCFPGLWLVGYSADAYRGSDSPTKK